MILSGCNFALSEISRYICGAIARLQTLLVKVFSLLLVKKIWRFLECKDKQFNFNHRIWYIIFYIPFGVEYCLFALRPRQMPLDG